MDGDRNNPSGMRRFRSSNHLHAPRLRFDTDIHDLMLEGTRAPQYPYFLRSRLKLRNSGAQASGRECRNEGLSAASKGSSASKNSEHNCADSSHFLQWGCEDKNYPETPCTSLCNVMDTLALTKSRRIRSKCTGNRAMVRSGSYTPGVDQPRKMGVINATIRKVHSGMHLIPEQQPQDQCNPQQANVGARPMESPKSAQSLQKTNPIPEAASYLRRRSPANPVFESVHSKDFSSIFINPDNCLETPSLAANNDSSGASQRDHGKFEGGLGLNIISPVEPGLGQYREQTRDFQSKNSFGPSADRDVCTPEQIALQKSDILQDRNSYSCASAAHTTSSRSPSVSSSVKALARKIRSGTFSTLSSLKSATPDSSESTFVEDEDLLEYHSHSYIVNDLKKYFQNLEDDCKDEMSLYDDGEDNASSDHNPHTYGSLADPIATEKTFFYVGEESGRVVKSQTEYPGAIIVTRAAKGVSKGQKCDSDPESCHGHPSHQSDFASVATLTGDQTNWTSETDGDNTYTDWNNNYTDINNNYTDAGTATAVPSSPTISENHIIGSKENLRLSSSHPFSLFLNKDDTFTKDPWTPMKKALKRSLNSRIASCGADDSFLHQLSARSNKARRTNLRRTRGFSFPPEANNPIPGGLPSPYLPLWTPSQNAQLQDRHISCPNEAENQT